MRSIILDLDDATDSGKVIDMAKLHKYDVYTLPDNLQGLYVLEVSGHNTFMLDVSEGTVNIHSVATQQTVTRPIMLADRWARDNVVIAVITPDASYIVDALEEDIEIILWQPKD